MHSRLFYNIRERISTTFESKQASNVNEKKETENLNRQEHKIIAAQKENMALIILIRNCRIEEKKLWQETDEGIEGC